MRLPADLGPCLKVLDRVDRRVERARARFKELAESRTGDERVQDQLMEVLERWFVVGRADEPSRARQRKPTRPSRKAKTRHAVWVDVLRRPTAKLATIPEDAMATDYTHAGCRAGRGTTLYGPAHALDVLGPGGAADHPGRDDILSTAAYGTILGHRGITHTLLFALLLALVAAAATSRYFRVALVVAGRAVFRHHRLARAVGRNDPGRRRRPFLLAAGRTLRELGTAAVVRHDPQPVGPMAQPGAARRIALGVAAGRRWSVL